VIVNNKIEASDDTYKEKILEGKEPEIVLKEISTL
jgi:hypothetical protein